MMMFALDPYTFRRSRCPNGPAWILTLFLLPHKRGSLLSSPLTRRCMSVIEVAVRQD
jgi:hypothetical protein